MDTENRLVQYLYGEEARPEEVEQQLASDDALRAEYHQLRAVKKQLDRRTPPQPEAAVIDRIVDAAASASAERSTSSQREAGQSDRAAVREDRDAVRSRRTTQRRVLQVASALAVLLVGVSVGLWQWEGSAPTEPSASSEAVQSSAVAPSVEESIPAWDEADNVVRLRRHIEALHARSSPTRWDYPGAELQTASQVRSSAND